MPDKIAYYLQHEDEREAIVEETHAFVTREHTMGRVVSRLVSLMRAETAAGVGMRSSRRRRGCGDGRIFR